jgi:uncharacterized membrane protein
MKMKDSLEGLNNRSELAKETISNFEHRLIKVMKYEERRRNIIGLKSTILLFVFYCLIFSFIPLFLFPFGLNAFSIPFYPVLAD